jgi:hypothetical protein
VVIGAAMYKLEDYSYFVEKVAFSPDGKQLAFVTAYKTGAVMGCGNGSDVAEARGS